MSPSERSFNLNKGCELRFSKGRFAAMLSIGVAVLAYAAGFAWSMLWAQNQSGPGTRLGPDDDCLDRRSAATLALAMEDVVLRASGLALIRQPDCRYVRQKHRFDDIDAQRSKNGP